MVSIVEPFGDCYVNISSPDCRNVFARILAKFGFATFDQIKSEDDFLELARLLGRVQQHRDSDERGITRIVDTGHKGQGFSGLTNKGLYPHTDRSSLKTPPTLVATYCEMPANSGGESILSDGERVYNYLKECFPDALEQLQLLESAVFLGGKRPLLSSIFTRGDNDRIIMRFRYDSFGFYSSDIIPFFPIFLQTIDAFKFSFLLNKGQGYVVQNGRWLHGRTAFSGKRVVCRVLIEPDKRKRDLMSEIKLGF